MTMRPNTFTLGKNGCASAIVNYAKNERVVEPDVEPTGRGEGYYTTTAPSEWFGGLTGDKAGEAVDLAEFKASLEAAGRHKEGRKCGTDLTFSAPKTVSIAGLMTGDTDLRAVVLAAHDEAVRRAMAHVEREVAVVRYKRGGREQMQSTIRAALFQHPDTRPVGDVVDPTLHTHSIVVNEGTDGRNLDLAFGYGGTVLTDMVYLSELAALLQNAGLELRDGSHSWEIAEITEQQKTEFSKRSGQIRAWLVEYGIDPDTATKAQKDAAVQATRADKKVTIDAEQKAEWEAAAEMAGISVTRGEPVERDETVTPEMLDAEVAGLSERDDVLDIRDLRLSLLQTHNRRTRLEYVDQAISLAIAQGHLIQIDEDRVVPRASVYREMSIIEEAKASAVGSNAIIVGDVASLIEAHERKQGFAFTEGQRQAVEMALTTTSKIGLIRGAAGAGKTTAMRVVVAAAQEAAEAGGYETVGLAPSTQARNELESAGAKINATLSRFILQGDRPGDDPKPRLIILDEAGMVSSKQMKALLDKLRDTDKLLLVGDQRQLQSVEAGKPYEALMQQGVVPVVEIDEINRQKVEPLMQIASAFAQGKAEVAADLARPYMDVVPVAQRAKGEKLSSSMTRMRAALADRAATTYLALSPDDREKTVMMTASNEARQMINKAVRAEMQKRDEVGADKTQIDALRQRQSLRVHERAQVKAYKVGNVVEYAADRKRLRGEVVEIDYKAGKLHLRDSEGKITKVRLSEIADSAQVFERQGEFKVGEGDRLQFRAKTQLGGTEVQNGDIGKVVEIAKDGVVTVELKRQTSKKEPIRVKIGKGDVVAVERAWACTIHSAQGLTEHRAIVVAEPTASSNANLGYVAASRETHELSIITSDADELVRRWSVYAQRTGALEAVDQAAQRIDKIGKQLDEVRDAIAQEIRDERANKELPPQLHVDRRTFADRRHDHGISL